MCEVLREGKAQREVELDRLDEGPSGMVSTPLSTKKKHKNARRGVLDTGSSKYPAYVVR